MPDKWLSYSLLNLIYTYIISIYILLPPSNPTQPTSEPWLIRNVKYVQVFFIHFFFAKAFFLVIFRTFKSGGPNIVIMLIYPILHRRRQSVFSTARSPCCCRFGVGIIYIIVIIIMARYLGHIHTRGGRGDGCRQNTGHYRSPDTASNYCADVKTTLLPQDYRRRCAPY